MSAAYRQLGVVASESAPAAPYPADTRAKGWRFELDYERIEQSDTWVLATPEMRPWLLMLWLSAWRQSPCGSLPAADELIAARIGMDSRQFRAHRDILMRGWWLADDGRLYHPVITEQVLSLIEVRSKDKARQEAWRSRKKGAQVKSMTCSASSHVTNAEIHVTHAGPTTPEPEPEPEVNTTPHPPAEDATPRGGAQAVEAKAPKVRGRGNGQSTAEFVQVGRPPDVSEQVWSDWVTLRRAHRAPITDTVLRGAVGQAGLAGMELEDFLAVWCRRGTRGLEASWLRQSERDTARQPMSFRERDQMAIRREWEARHPGRKWDDDGPAALDLNTFEATPIQQRLGV